MLQFVLMPASGRSIELALCILVSLAGRRTPEQPDVDELRKLAPDLDHLPPGELASEVMKRDLTVLDSVRV